METKFACRIITHSSENSRSHNLSGMFLKLLHIHPEDLQHTQWKMNMMRLSAVSFLGRVDQSHSTIESCTKEFVSNASAQLFPKNTVSSFTKFLPEQLNLEGQWEVAILEISYPSMYQNVTEGKFPFDKKLPKSSDFYCLEPGSYPSITDIVEALIILIQEGRKSRRQLYHNWSVSKNAKKWDLPWNGGFGVTFFIKDLDTTCCSNVGNEFGVMLRGTGPHKLEFAYDIFPIHSLMLFTDLIEYFIIGDTRTPLLCCFLFISNLKAGDIITTGSYMNFQTFSKLQFKPLLKKSFHSIQIDLRATRGEKLPFHLSISLAFFMLWEAFKFRI